MKKVLSYITCLILIACGAIFILLGFTDGLRFFPILVGLVLAYIGLLVPAAYKNKESKQSFEDSLVIMKVYVAGVSFRQDSVQSAYDEFMKYGNANVDLVLDSENDFNKDAVKVMVNDFHVGFIPDRYLSKYNRYLATYDYVQSSVEFVEKDEIFIDLTIYFKKK